MDIPLRKPAREKEHYVNNKEFTAAVSEWARLVKKAKKEGTEIPPVTTYIAGCIMKITERYSKKPNFSGYTYLDEMKSNAIFLSLKYAHNFDPEKSSNAFAYFTTVINNAFIAIINSENKYAALKFNVFKEQEFNKIGGNDYRNIRLGEDDDESNSFFEDDVFSEERTALDELNEKKLKEDLALAEIDEVMPDIEELMESGEFVELLDLDPDDELDEEIQ